MSAPPAYTCLPCHASLHVSALPRHARHPTHPSIHPPSLPGSKKDDAPALAETLQVLQLIKGNFDEANPSHRPHLDCLRAAVAEVPVVAAALAHAAATPPPRVSLGLGRASAGASAPAPRVSVLGGAARAFTSAQGKRAAVHDPSPFVPSRALFRSGSRDRGSDEIAVGIAVVDDPPAASSSRPAASSSSDEDDDDVAPEAEPSGFFTAAMSAAMTQALPVRVGAIAQAMEGPKEARRRTISSIRNQAQAELTLSGGYMCTAQAESDFAMYRMSNSLTSMYSEKRPNQRGRMLPGGQLPAARARVERALTTKSWTQPRGYGANSRAGLESDSDSDGDSNVRAGAGAGARGAAGAESSAAGSTPELPYGYKTKYVNTPPAVGARLVGWVVVAYFPAADQWFDGVVVCQLPSIGSKWYSVFHETENFYEEWELPDDEIYFRKPQLGGHRVTVQPNMLPPLQ